MGEGSSARRERVGGWLDSVSTPGLGQGQGQGQGTNGPMAFAAMMMGLPIAPMQMNMTGAGMMVDEEMMEDPMGILDDGPEGGGGGGGGMRDEDLEDLREEVRPRLRERWVGWVECAGEMGGTGKGNGNGKEVGRVLGRVYEEVVRMMPWMEGGDVVEEMINRCVSFFSFLLVSTNEGRRRKC